MNSERALRERIMRRVWGVYLMRRLMSPAMRLGALGGIAIALVSSVSMKHVIANALGAGGPIGLARFSVYAVANTTLFVQVLILLAFALGVWFIVDAVRSVAFTRQMRMSV